MTILILSLIIAGIGTGSFFWLKGLYKKNKSLKLKLEFADAQIDQMNENQESYSKTVIELKELRGKYDNLRTQIINSTGSKLSINLNEL